MGFLLLDQAPTLVQVLHRKDIILLQHSSSPSEFKRDIEQGIDQVCNQGVMLRKVVRKVLHLTTMHTSHNKMWAWNRQRSTSLTQLFNLCKQWMNVGGYLRVSIFNTTTLLCPRLVLSLLCPALGWPVGRDTWQWGVGVAGILWLRPLVRAHDK